MMRKVKQDVSNLLNSMISYLELTPEEQAALLPTINQQTPKGADSKTCPNEPQSPTDLELSHLIDQELTSTPGNESRALGVASSIDCMVTYLYN